MSAAAQAALEKGAISLKECGVLRTQPALAASVEGQQWLRLLTCWPKTIFQAASDVGH